ncbi:MAG: hypothetical protein ACK5WV_12495, partial [Chryseotalea sp.]
DYCVLIFFMSLVGGIFNLMHTIRFIKLRFTWACPQRLRVGVALSATSPATHMLAHFGLSASIAHAIPSLR